MKKTGVAYIIWLVLGLIGGHRYYLGRWATGLLMTVTVGGLGVWWLIDAFLLPGMVRKVNEGSSPTVSTVPTGVALVREQDVVWRPADWSTTGLILSDGGSQVRVTPKDISEARDAIRDLQLRKKQIGIEKKTLSTLLAGAKTQHRTQAAKENARYFRPSAAGKRQVRANQAVALAPHEQTRMLLDLQMSNIDGIVQQLETMILREQTRSSVV